MEGQDDPQLLQLHEKMSDIQRLADEADTMRLGVFDDAEGQEVQWILADIKVRAIKFLNKIENKM